MPCRRCKRLSLLRERKRIQHSRWGPPLPGLRSPLRKRHSPRERRSIACRETLKDDRPVHTLRRNEEEDNPMGGKVHVMEEDNPMGGKVHVIEADNPMGGKVQAIEEDNPIGGKVQYIEEDNPMGGKVQAIEEDNPMGGKVQAIEEDNRMGDKVQAIEEDNPMGDKVQAIKEDNPMGGKVQAIEEDNPMGGKLHVMEEDKPMGANVQAMEGLAATMTPPAEEEIPRTETGSSPRGSSIPLVIDKHEKKTPTAPNTVCRSFCLARKFCWAFTQSSFIHDLEQSYVVVVEFDNTKNTVHIRGERENVLGCLFCVKTLLAQWRQRLEQ